MCTSRELVGCIHDSLEASETQLYGLETDNPEHGRLVLLESCTLGSLLESGDMLPGWSLGLQPLAGTSSPESTVTTPAGHHLHLLQHAVAVRSVVTDGRCESGFGIGGNGLLTGCAHEGQPTLLSAALPLAFGDRVVGVLRITDRKPHGAGRLILSNPAALQQLAVSASLALAAVSPIAGLGVGGTRGAAVIGCLAASLRRLADSASLQELVSELRQALSQYVLRQFLLDVSVHVAVVPQPDSRNAFMLHVDDPPLHSTAVHARTQAQAAPPVYGSALPARGGVADRLTSVAGSPRGAALSPSAAAVAVADQLRGSFRSSNFERCLRAAPEQVLLVDRSASQSAMRRPAGALPGGGGGSCGDGLQGTPAGPASINRAPGLSSAHTATGPSPRRSVRIVQLPPPGGAASAAAGNAPMAPEQARSLDHAAIASAAAAAACGVAGGSNTPLVAALVPSLRAKAFHLSHTLLQRMVVSRRESGSSGGAGSHREAGVYVGAQVPACARWVQDVRQPSRDVYLVMGSGMTASAGEAAASRLRPDSGGAGGGGGDGSTVQSLALLGMDAGGGAVLGLYIGFSTQLPPQLLEAVATSCGQLLRKLAIPVRAKLQGELAAELGTVLAGVPGSYASFTLSPAPPPPPPAAILTSVEYGFMTTASSGVAGSVGAAVGPHTAEFACAPSRLARTTTMVSCNSQLFLGEGADPVSHSGGLVCVDPFATAAAAAMLLPGSGSGNPVVSTEPRHTNGGMEFLGELTGEASHGEPRLKPKLSGRPRVKQTHFGRYPNAAAGGGGGGGGSPHARASSRLTGIPTVTSGVGDAIHLGSPVGGGGPLTAPLRMGSSVGAAHPGDALVTSQDVLPDVGALTSILTVHEVDGGSSMRAQMGLLVDAVMGTLRSNTLTVQASEDTRKTALTSGSLLSSRTAPDCNASLESGDDLDDLQLYEILGDGSSGVVLRGLLGTSPVAVKLMELPDVDGVKSEDGVVAEGPQAVPAARPLKAGGEEALQLDARRTMLRNAMELAVLRSVAHINIVQCHAVYDNVRLEKVAAPGGGNGRCVLRRQPNQEEAPDVAPGVPTSPACIAIVTELCTHGSLAGALSDRSFPKALTANSIPLVGGGGVVDSSSRPHYVHRVDFQGIYLTLLDIAMALRYLHARRLVHRDVKPANVLLKESPGDPRGWTCKLADFGFALVLDQQGPSSGAEAAAAAASASGRPTSALSAADIAMTFSQQLQQQQPQQQGGGQPVWFTVQEQACGTVTHMAPEALRRSARIDASVDIFAFGVIMWELLCGRGQRPYPRLTPEDIPRAVMAGLRPSFPEEAPPAYRRLAQACWAADPASRPRASEVVFALKVQMAALQSQSSQQPQQNAVRRGRTDIRVPA